MRNPKRADFDEPSPLLDGEDAETLAAIDRGVRSADEGKLIPLEEVRQRIEAWPTKSSSRKMR
jgi:predicted transcriptional regulator